MQMLALNLGSATLKAAAFEIADAGGHGPVPMERVRIELPVRSDSGPEDRLWDLLRKLPESARQPDAVVHRIVHGGDFAEGVELSDEVIAQLGRHASLAPLHQAAALALAVAARSRWPRARHGAAFDTSFHLTLAPWSRRLPIPEDWHAAGLRRFGFHGLAFASALRKVGAIDPSALGGRAVLAHLGGGCSVCAVAEGRSIDTTMSTTPLGGIPGPTRSGDLDPGLVLHLLRQPGADPEVLGHRLSHESGLAGIAGHGDIRALLLDATQPEADLAIEQFTWRVAQAIAAMAIAAGGIEHLVFSGGIGHRSAAIRTRIVRRLGGLGLSLDRALNANGATRISPSGRPAVWNIDVDEEEELVASASPWLGVRVGACS